MNIKKSLFLILMIFITITCFANKKKEATSIVDFFSSSEFLFTEYDESSVFIYNTFGKISKKETVFVQLDDTESFGFGSNYDLAYTYVLFDSKGREILRNALNMYLSDFENKKLDRKRKKTDKAYGSINVEFVWGSIKSQAKNNGKTRATIGYKFKDNSPYFTITCAETENVRFDPNNPVNPKSSFVAKYYFTKSQITDLVNFLSDENISAILENNIIIENDIVPDSY